MKNPARPQQARSSSPDDAVIEDEQQAENLRLMQAHVATCHARPQQANEATCPARPQQQARSSSPDDAVI